MTALTLTTTIEEITQEKAEMRQTIKEHEENSRDLRATVREMKEYMKKDGQALEVAYKVINLTGAQVKCLYGVINENGTILLASGSCNQLKTGLLNNAAVVNAYWDKFVAKYGDIEKEKASAKLAPCSTKRLRTEDANGVEEGVVQLE